MLAASCLWIYTNKAASKHGARSGGDGQLWSARGVTNRGAAAATASEKEHRRVAASYIYIWAPGAPARAAPGFNLPRRHAALPHTRWPGKAPARRCYDRHPGKRVRACQKRPRLPCRSHELSPPPNMAATKTPLISPLMTSRLGKHAATTSS